MPRRRTIHWLTLTGLIGVIAVLSASASYASPISNPGGWPYSKLDVYSGVITITPGGPNALEIGNNGRDIAALGTIYLRPGNLAEGSSLLVGRSLYNDAYLDLRQGRICLYANGGTTADCRSDWPVTGDYWDQITLGGLTFVQPNGGARTVQQIGLGTWAAPIPSANGFALDAAGDFTGPVFYALGTLTTGHQDLSLNWSGGNIKASQLQTNNKPPTYLGSANNVPWSSYNQYNPATGAGSGIDADTFDGQATTLFSTDHNLFWKERASYDPVTQAVTTKEYMCLHTTNAKLCINGATPGQACNTDGDCSGGSCISLCGSTPQSCPADPAPSGANGRCSVSNSPCSTTADCSVVGESCVRGIRTEYPAASCTDSSCTTACQQQTRCNGATVPLCGGFGSSVKSDTGQCIGYKTAGGVQDCVGGNCACDCRLTTAVSYLQAVAPGSGGDLCTPAFQ